MANTDIDLTIGLNLQIGSVPVSLSAQVETDSDKDVYTFGGSVQDAVIDIGSFISYVGQQFGAEVELPPELNLEADIDYVAGQVIYTKPKGSNADKATTELGVAAKFDLVYENGGNPETFTLSFYADTILTADSDTKTYVFGGAIDTDLAFKDLPLIGSIPVVNEYVLKHLGFSYTNADPAENDGKPVTFHLPQVSQADNPLKTEGSPPSRESNTYTIDNSGDATTFKLNNKGFAFTAGFMKEGSDAAEDNFALPMALPTTTPPSTPASYYQSDGNVDASPPDSPINWIEVNKTFGPVDLQKIGLNYRAGEATFGLSAGFTVAGVALDLEGLAITFPLPLPGMPAGNKVAFDLQGMGLDFSKGSFNIGGAFLKAEIDGITNYFGQAIIQIAKYGLKAIGGYAPAQGDDPAAFFLYANLEVPLGGPPFLYVSGLAFGFGVNYQLNLPTIDTLPGYLLLPGNAPKQPDKPADAFSGVLGQLAGGTNPVVQNAPGQYWVAAGIQFTSFNLISAFALVTFSFGVDFQVGLLGSASITLPTGSPDPLGYLEIDLVASFTPDSGVLAVAGVISPASYILGDYVKLSGGFAFDIWFSGEHAGDFVATLGGYYPSYDKPDWYPTVPKLALAFALGPFQAAGSAYVALTPSLLMGGMQFKATYALGTIKAWFSAGVDFLLGWAPFFYRADAYVSVGCSVDMGLFTLKVSVGADLQVWGPPFGGKAEVDLDIVKFTISFGSEQPNPIPVSWDNVKENFLPGADSLAVGAPRSQSMARMAAAPVAAAQSDIVSVSVQTGLLQTDVQDAEGRSWNWILDPNQFQIVTATTIPANLAQWATGASGAAALPNVLADYNTEPPSVGDIPYLALVDPDDHFSSTEVWNPNLNVRPMQLKQVKSTHTIALIKADADGVFNDYIAVVEIQPVLGAAAAALWGDPDTADDVNGDTLLPDTLLGFNVVPLPRNPDRVSSVPLIQLLFTVGNETTFAHTGSQPDPDYTVTASVDPPEYELVMRVRGAKKKNFTDRNFVLDTLTNNWVTRQRNGVLDDLTANGFRTLTPDEIDLAVMASTERLTDWPQVGLLGDPIA
ncbi:MAG: DUF6603 domain-containing protein [Bacteroidota bacterium]